jgi:hypothetical protein
METELFSKPSKVNSGVSFCAGVVGVLGNAVVGTSDANARNLLQLCSEFKVIELAKIVGY